MGSSLRRGLLADFVYVSDGDRAANLSEHLDISPVRLPLRPLRGQRPLERIHQRISSGTCNRSRRQARAGEVRGDRWPSLRQAARLLDSYADDPEPQLDRLAAIITYTVLTGNADAHGKNLAHLHPTPERIGLASLYDIVPTALWPKLRTDAAMSIGGQVSLADVTFANILREVAAWSHPGTAPRRLWRNDPPLSRKRSTTRESPYSAVTEFVRAPARA